MTVETDSFSSCQRRAVPSNRPQPDIKLEKQLLLHPNEALPTDPDQLDRTPHCYSRWAKDNCEPADARGEGDVVQWRSQLFDTEKGHPPASRTSSRVGEPGPGLFLT